MPGAPICSTMMNFPLTLSHIRERAQRLFPDIEIVALDPGRGLLRSNYGELCRNALRLAQGLRHVGLRRGERVATLMWNHQTHLEAYFGIPAAGGVLHPLNLRLHAEELAWIVNHAGDRFLLMDEELRPVYESIRKDVNFEQVYVRPAGADRASGPGGSWDTLFGMTASDPPLEPLEPLDENEAAAMCYTSGTTGRSKGVVYSHRALVLHSFAVSLEDAFGISQHETVLALAPMFHANAWGIPFAAAMVGAKLVLPGSTFDPETMLSLIEVERITLACAVPTIWIGVLAALERHPNRWKISHPVRVICGGSAPSEALLRGLDHFGFHVRHSWGMTETTPMATVGKLKSTMIGNSESEQYAVRLKQGIPAPFVELRVSTASGVAPLDGCTVGELEARGPWVASSYYNSPDQTSRWTPDGWFRTGDMATLDPNGYLQLVDRLKDMIKSGGEWISSVNLETALMDHPAVLEAAVIGVPHAKWQERPLAAVVLKEGAMASPEELREFLAMRFARWQLPDAFVFLPAIPRTSVGKFQKSLLRERFAGWKWEE